MENPILETHVKNTVNVTEKPRSTAFSPIFGMPYYGVHAVNSASESNTTLTLDTINKIYNDFMEKTVINQPAQKPYWIIVSDEGHAKIPIKHFVKAEAEKEAQRLTEKQPGVTFTVFESKSSVFTPKEETKKTEYAELHEPRNSWPFIPYPSYPYFGGRW